MARKVSDTSLAAKYKDPVVTMKHRQLARVTAEYGGVPGMTKKKLAQLAGLKTAGQVFEAPGFKVALSEYGLTESLVAKALVADIKAKPQKRLGELSLAAEILGMKKHTEVNNSKNLTLIISGETAERYGALQPKHIEAVVVEKTQNALTEPGQI